MTLGNKIYHYRKLTNLSQEELANKLDVTRQSVSLWENDLVLPSIENLKALSNIFNVSIDELLENKQETNSKNENTPLFVTHIRYNNEIYKNLYSNSTRKFVTIGIVCIIACIIMFIGIFLSSLSKSCLIIPLFFILITSTTLIKLKVNINKKINGYYSSKPNLVSLHKFYKDHIVIESKSDFHEGTTTKKYSEILNKYQDDKYIYLLFNDLSTVIDKSTYDGNIEDILNILGIHKKEVKEKKSTKTISLILFILSFVSILFFVLILEIVIESQPIPEFPSIMPSFMWIAFIVMLIPLASLIFGIILTAKKRKYKKNIISGAIMSTILCIYGCFSFLYKSPVVNDYTYLQTLSEQVNIDIPDGGYLLISYDETHYNSLAMYKINDEDANQFVEQLNNNTNFKNDVSFIPSGIIDYPTLLSISSTKDYDYFAIYNTSTNKYNDYGDSLIYMAYDIETSILYIAYIKLEIFTV